MSRKQTLQKEFTANKDYLGRKKEERERKSIKELAEEYFEISLEEEKNFDTQTIIKLISIRGIDKVVLFLENLPISKFQDIYSQFSDLEKVLIKVQINEVSRARFHLD